MDSSALLSMREALDWQVGQWIDAPYDWMKSCVRTIDEQEQIAARPFPDRPYLRDFIAEIHAHRFIANEKSRQMFNTWALGAYVLFDSQFKPGSRWGVLSTKVDTADAVLDRIWYMREQQPGWLRSRYPARRKENWIEFDSEFGLSWIQALTTTQASGRSYTFSGVWIDEAAWQDMVCEAYTANLPAVQDKGRMWLTSSTQAGTFFCDIVDDTMEAFDDELGEGE